jgi:DNA-binding CsgD family transcriptional regulator
VLGVPGAGLVGRQSELRRLLRLLDAVAASEPAQALVSGDAGVGKTRLVAELAAAAAEREFTVLSGRCAELGDSIPYLPLADALRDATTGPGADQGLLDAIEARPVLGRLLPDRGAEAPPADLPGLAQQQLFGAVLGMLAELAARRPVLLVLEDLHWADRSTRDLVTFLSRVLHRERVAVVATYRTDDLHRRHPLRLVVAELLRLPGVTSIELGPLGDEAIAAHLAALARTPLSADRLRRIVTRAEGNPYYAEELLAADEGNCPTDGNLPTGLAALLTTRFESMSPTAQQVLRAAAVAGRRMEDDLVREASGLEAAEYEEAIRESVTHQLLVPDGEYGYAFRHALIREAIYADLLPGERTRLHATFAELLADDQRLATVPGTAAELAHHYLASHDITGAFTASVQAAQEAERLAAPAEAQRHYDQALELWDRVTGAEELAGRTRAKLAFASAGAAGASGDVARAVQKFRRIREYLNDTGDPVLTSRVCERLAYYLLELEDVADAVEAARAAVDAVGEEPPRWERGRALATYAQTLMYSRAETAAATWAKHARAAARKADAPWVEADALVTMGQLSERRGKVADAIRQFTMAYQHAVSAGVLGVELRAAFQLSRAHLERGDLDDASRIAHEGVQRAEESGLHLAPYGLDLQYLHYLAHFADGLWDHAAELADGFAVRATTAAEARLSAMALFIDVARGSATVADRRTWLEPFWDTDRFVAYISRGLLAEHALWRGNTEEALVDVTAALATYGGAGYGPTAIRVAAVGLAAHADRAAQARATGDQAGARAETEAAGTLIEAAREGAAFTQQPGFVLGIEGRGWLARAEAEWQRAQGNDDPAIWQAVVDVFAPPGFAYETARARWRLAQALAEAGRRDDAQREWEQASKAADHLGAVPLQRALADLARRARLGPRESGYQAPGPLASLTAREREVLRLLSEGRSNREIAAALFIAPKTASVHVSNILGKLGASTRTEAAAIAYREGPVG